MKNIALLLLLFTCISGFAQVKQTVGKSSVTYQVKNMGFNSSGSFGGLQAAINFDKAKPESSSISASIEVSTLNSDNTMRDNHLKSEDYFDAARYPKIVMQSVSVKNEKGNNYLGVFNITIKDKTKQVNVPFTYTETGNQGAFKGTFAIKRSYFGIGGKSMMLADDVTITVDVQTTF